MGDYESVPNQEQPVVEQTHSNHELIESRATDPLVSSFGASDSDDESEWEDDRTRDRRLSVSSDSSSQMPASSSNSPSPPRGVFSLWNSMLGAIQQRRHNGNMQRSTEPADGVFENLVAKEDGGVPDEEGGQPVLNAGLLSDDDDDLTPRDQPPTYDEASADATPSYWETTILSSSFADEIIVGHMAVGSPIVFAWYLLITCTFSYMGFLVSYLVHTTHAARGGAFSGLGITLIQSSYSMAPEQSKPPGAPPDGYYPLDPNSFKDGPPIGYTLHPTGQSTTQPSTKPEDYTTFSRIVFILGIVLLFKGVVDYLMALRLRSAIRNHQAEQIQSSSNAQEIGRSQFETRTTPHQPPGPPSSPPPPASPSPPSSPSFSPPHSPPPQHAVVTEQ